MEEPGQGEATLEVNTDTAATDMQEEFGERKEIYPVVTPPPLPFSQGVTAEGSSTCLI